MRARQRRPLAGLIVACGLALALLAGSRPTQARDITDDILAQTADLRGLPAKAQVPFAFVPADQLKSDLLQSYNNETTVRELEVSRKLLVLLGLLSPDADLHGILVELYSENVLGYYNNADKKMYLVSGQTTLGPQEKMTLSHEFTHALQDQYFDLAKVQAGLEDNGDRSLAVTALVEGDATLAMIRYAREYLTPDEVLQIQLSSAGSSIDRAPLVVRDEVTFPYNEGALFAVQLWQQGGNEALNQAFRKLPTSTEQIIHPEKYLAGEQPIEVTLPDLVGALGPGWQQLRTDVLGELDLRILLEQFSEPGAAANGAQGWGGDRFAILENAAGDDAVVVSTVWDDEQEAIEFYGAYAETVVRRYGGRARRTADGPTRLVWSTPNGALLLQRWGARVAIVMAPEGRPFEALVAAMQPAGQPAPAAQPTPTPPARPAPAQQPSPQPAPVQVPR